MGRVKSLRTQFVNQWSDRVPWLFSRRLSSPRFKLTWRWQGLTTWYFSGFLRSPLLTIIMSTIVRHTTYNVISTILSRCGAVQPSPYPSPGLHCHRPSCCFLTTHTLILPQNSTSDTTADHCELCFYRELCAGFIGSLRSPWILEKKKSRPLKVLEKSLNLNVPYFEIFSFKILKKAFL